MVIKLIPKDFCVCKVKDLAQVSFQDEYCFFAKTDEELSLVCTKDCIPEDTLVKETGWKAFRIQGILDFSQIGILSSISVRLAENNISIFAVSTYNTDYIFVKEDKFQKAIAVLKECGYTIE